MTYQPHQSEDLTLKTVLTEEELRIGDLESTERRRRDPFNQAAADRATREELQHPDLR